MSLPLEAGTENCAGPENGEIPAELVRKSEEIVKQYPASKRSAVLPLLHL